MRAVHPVGVRRFVGGARDDRGNPTETWADLVEVLVYAVAPATSDEPAVARDEIVERLTILAPEGYGIDYRDLVIVDGLTYRVIGTVADWSRGPFAYTPGVSITVERADG